MRIRLRSTHIGIAIGNGSLAASGASPLHSDAIHSVPLGGAPGANGNWPELEAALAELRSLIPPDRTVRASMVLLPSVAQVRRLALPALRSDERRAVLSRDASRWFVDAREPFVADALVLPGMNGELMAAAIPARYADAIGRAATIAGMEVATIQAAPWAWAASLGNDRRRIARAIAIGGVRFTTIVQLSRGTVTGVRRVRAGTDVDAKLGELPGESGGPGRLQRIEDGLITAATFAARARGPELLGQSARAAHRVGVMRRARAIVLAAAAMLLVAAGVDFWGVQRQLAVVRAERARIREDVARAMASRDSVVTVEAQLGAVVAQVHGAPRWTAVVANLTEFVPEEAWLHSITAAGDSVSLVGEATHAADVIESLRRDPAITALRADAPIRREMSPDRASVEHFGLTVRLAQSSSGSSLEKQP